MTKTKRQGRKKPNLPPPPATTKEPITCIDLLFIHDCTRSQGPYIAGTVRRCSEMVEVIRDLGQVDFDMGLRVGLIAFRDHQEDEDFLTRDFGGFTHDVETVIKNLQSLVADGGGDRPEAVTAAMAHCLKLDWRDGAAKLVVLVTDAPPHGIGEDDDDYPEGDPNGHDPLDLARKMAERGITMLLVACEPSLSNDYKYAHDFYTALTEITLGRIVPLTDIRVLTPLIIGFALEHLAIDSLAREFMEPVRKMHEEGLPLEDITDTLRSWLLGRGEQIITPKVKQVYKEPPGVDKVVEKWVTADSIRSIEPEIRQMAKVQKRVRSEHIEPSTGWPIAYVDITLKNLDDFHVLYKYRDPDPSHNSVERSGNLRPQEIQNPQKFLAHTAYNFKFKSGSRETQFILKNFDRNKSWDVSRHFM